MLKVVEPGYRHVNDPRIAHVEASKCTDKRNQVITRMNDVSDHRPAVHIINELDVTRGTKCYSHSLGSATEQVEAQR